MNMRNLIIVMAAALSLPAMIVPAEARPTEIRITVEYKLTTDPAQQIVEIKGEEVLAGTVDRKEVPVRSGGGLAGALNSVADTIDTSGYTKVGTIVRDGRAYDVYERPGSGGGKVTGVARVHVSSRPTAGGMELTAQSGDVETASDSGETPELTTKRQALIGRLLEKAAQVEQQLTGFHAFSEDEVNRLFGYEPATVSKTISYTVEDVPAELTVTVHSEVRRIIDAPLGEDP